MLFYTDPPTIHTRAFTYLSHMFCYRKSHSPSLRPAAFLWNLWPHFWSRVNDEELMIVYEKRKGQQSEVTKRTLRRNAPKTPSMNSSAEKEKEYSLKKKTRPQTVLYCLLTWVPDSPETRQQWRRPPTSKCLSRSIQEHLVAFLYYQRGTKRATVCYCTQSEGPLLLNLMKWNWKVQLRSSTYRRKRSSEVSHRRKTQKPNFATEESRKDESRPWNDSRKTKENRPAQSYSSRWLISMSRITPTDVSIKELKSQNL